MSFIFGDGHGLLDNNHQQVCFCVFFPGMTVLLVLQEADR